MSADGVDELLARCTFPASGTIVVCAVSGGADSTALLALALAAGCEATAIHVDHGLRTGSPAESDVVRATAERLGAGFRALTVAVADGPDLEARARRARYAVLPADVLTGHTADDQAETVLLQMLRGASTRGLAGMRAGRDHGGVQRPILRLRRSETTELCRRLGLEVVHDPSNADPRHRRNRVRHEVLPLLADIGRRDVVAIISRQAELLRDDDDLLDELAGAIDPTDARALAAAPPALARRAVRAWLAAADPRHRPVDADTVRRVLAVAAGSAVGCEVGEGRRVRRSGQRLSISDAVAAG